MSNKGVVKDKSDNELIAEFMDGRFDPELAGGRWLFETQPTPYYRLDSNHIQLRYDTDWNWLHPVIVRIAEYGLNTPYFKAAPQALKVCSTAVVRGIDEHYKNVVDFIRWYNEKLKQ